MAGNPRKRSPSITRAATAGGLAGRTCGGSDEEPDPHPAAAIRRHTVPTSLGWSFTVMSTPGLGGDSATRAQARSERVEADAPREDERVEDPVEQVTGVVAHAEDDDRLDREDDGPEAEVGAERVTAAADEIPERPGDEDCGDEFHAASQPSRRGCVVPRRGDFAVIPWGYAAVGARAGASRRSPARPQGRRRASGRARACR